MADDRKISNHNKVLEFLFFDNTKSKRNLIAKFAKPSSLQTEL